MHAEADRDDLTLDWPETLAPAADSDSGADSNGSTGDDAVRRRGSRVPADAADDTPSRVRLPVSALLRGLGALVVAGAFLLYLFQGWRDGDALTRVLLLLGHTLALTVLGFGLGHWLREPRGARLCIALALAALPVSFAFLGGLLYDHLGQVLPSPATAGFWQPAHDGALGLGSTLALTLSATVVLALASGIGFLVLARRCCWGSRCCWAPR